MKKTLTIPKIKDLVNSSNQKYQHIYDTISNNEVKNDYTYIDSLPLSNDNFIDNDINNNEIDMKDELKSFLKKQLNTNI